MDILLDAISKRFNKDWIFRNLSFQFKQGSAYAITGNNGSGKSTLLQCIAGATAINKGICTWKTDGFEENTQSGEHIHQYFSFAAPYLDVIEEMTALEFLKFHQAFKPFIADISLKKILQEVQLEDAADKQIRNYSSGMKQRIKLGMAIFSNTPVLLLDEPCSNFDKAGFELYRYLIQNYCKEKLIIVCSNDPEEYEFFCKESINIRDYKPSKENASV